MKIVVFDVDNTLVKGHLVRLYIKALVLRNPFLVGHFFKLAYLGLLLLLYIPRLLKNALRAGDLVALDRGLLKIATRLTTRVYAIFDELGYSAEMMRCSMKKIVLQDRFERYLHTKALRMLELHLANPQTMVILASASIEECMEPFYEWLCSYMQQRGVATQERLFFVATHKNRTTGHLAVCLGEQKLKRIEVFLRQKALVEPVTTVYTDNQFLADLPLLMKAKANRYVVGRFSVLYTYLPTVVVQGFKHYPLWYPE